MTPDHSSGIQLLRDVMDLLDFKSGQMSIKFKKFACSNFRLEHGHIPDSLFWVDSNGVAFSGVATSVDKSESHGVDWKATLAFYSGSGGLFEGEESLIFVPDPNKYSPVDSLYHGIKMLVEMKYSKRMIIRSIDLRCGSPFYQAHTVQIRTHSQKSLKVATANYYNKKDFLTLVGLELPAQSPAQK